MIPVEQVQCQPFHLRATIPIDYLDDFGHMNIQWYVKLFNDAIWHLMADLGMDTTYFEKEQVGVVALEQHIRYLAEVRAGQTVALHSRVLGRSEKRMHFMQFMINETQQALAATIEVLATHFDRKVRRSSPFPPPKARIIDARIQQDSQLDWQPPLCGPLIEKL